MKSILLIALAFALPIGARGQQQPGVAPIARPRILNPGGATPGGQAESDLSRNYRLVINFKSGDKAAREIMLLTASAQVRVSAVLDQEDVTQGTGSMEVSGVLTEKEDGRLRFSYQFGASVPVVTQTLPMKPASGNGQPVPVVSNVQYVNESATGVLVMEQGKPYEIFKSAARSYTVTIQPETPSKEK